LKAISIVISTRNRIEKLVKTIKSIPKKSNIVIHIFCDGDIKTLNFLRNNEELWEFKAYTLWHYSKHQGAVKCRNNIIYFLNDGILYATDDMTFEPNSIENAFNAFNTHFPDDDGVVGFVQIPDNFHPTGVALVGKKFLQRYPERALFWPGYFHFACQEIYWLASKLGKFHQEPTAIIRHYHPAFFRDEMDETHIEARKYREKDHTLMKERQAKGLIWGDA